MSKELNKAPVEQAEPASCQGTNCGTTTGDHSSECLAEAAASQGWELKPGDLCGRDCPMRPATAEQAGGDERDLQAEGAQEVPSPVSQEYDRHLISLLRKGEALPGHQEEAADEIERLRDWNDHLNNTVLPNILNPNFLMLMKGGERLLDLCTKDGKFIGVSLNDMKDVFDWMVTHARIAPDHAALAQPSTDAPYADGIAADLERSDWTPEDALRWYAAGKHFDTVNGRTRIIDTGAVASNALKHLSLPYLEMKGDAELTELREAMAQPSPAQAEAERPEVVGYLATAEHPKHGQPHKALNYFKDQHDAQVAHWRERGCEVSEDELMAVAQHERIVASRWERAMDLMGEHVARISDKLAAERDAAQAQHSVPEEFIGRLSEFLAQRGATGKALLRELRTMLASAPGKEGNDD